MAPDEAATFSEDDLQRLVLASEGAGRTLGLESEQAHARWAYVMIRTRGNALQQPGLREYITDGQTTPDKKVELLLQTIAAIGLGRARGDRRRPAGIWRL